MLVRVYLVEKKEKKRRDRETVHCTGYNIVLNKLSLNAGLHSDD
jgi:hypothetical protein